MDKARAIIDYSYNDEGKAVRDVLYSAIQDKVLAHIESHKQEVAKTLIVPEESENELEDDLEDDLELEMEEEYAELDEDVMTHITLGKKVKNKEGGHDQDVHYKGKKIGSISSYSHRTGTRYGMHHDATGDMTAGSRSAEDAIADLRFSHAEHLKDSRMEEEYAELDEISKERATAAYVARMGRDDKDNDAKALKTITHIGNKHGVKGVARAVKAADKEYGLNDKNNPRKYFVKQIMSGTKTR